VKLDDYRVDLSQPLLKILRKDVPLGSLDVDLQDRDPVETAGSQQRPDIDPVQLRGLPRACFANCVRPLSAISESFLAKSEADAARPDTRLQRGDSSGKSAEVFLKHLEVRRIRLDGDDSASRETAQKIRGRVAHVCATIHDEPCVSYVIQAPVFAIHENLSEGIEIAGASAVDEPDLGVFGEKPKTSPAGDEGRETPRGGVRHERRPAGQSRARQNSSYAL
jgi:hypothetical protein